MVLQSSRMKLSLAVLENFKYDLLRDLISQCTMPKTPQQVHSIKILLQKSILSPSYEFAHVDKCCGRSGFGRRRKALTSENQHFHLNRWANQNLTVIPNCYRYHGLFSALFCCALVKVPLTLCCKAFKGNILSGAFNGGNAVSAHF
ncbi:hypothetical protein CEXT_620431 [Caerostris extrusa]|uniref:Uncharacterized protein n=1 Tax=Caerostris extrusa TaxID=172846 RepID=A0AAV4P3L9_CAEEX|nr:hypothetical protein CEXT_620431 [Caerostris extrusa]